MRAVVPGEDSPPAIIILIILAAVLKKRRACVCTNVKVCDCVVGGVEGLLWSRGIKGV